MSFRTTVAVAILSAALAGNVHDRSFYESKFYSWMTEHNVKIESGAKFVTMLQNFANNDDVIEAHNAKKSTYKLGHNKFSGMSNDEFKAYVNQGGYKKRTTPSGAKFIHNAPSDKSILKSEVNWVTAGAVTDVKDQGQCGSCWSFSTTGALEGAYAVKGNALTSFSEQYLVSCDNRKNGGTDMGCNGGLMDAAFEWSESNGVMSESSYPYTSGAGDSGECDKTEGQAVSGATPKSYTDVKTTGIHVDGDAAMMSALNQQPVAIAIEADQAAFQLYKSGVFTAECGDSLDHGVLAVGYGTEDGEDYYLVKNSWGSSWGDAGYIKLGRGSAYGSSGQCGMLSEPSYPNL